MCQESTSRFPCEEDPIELTNLPRAAKSTKNLLSAAVIIVILGLTVVNFFTKSYRVARAQLYSRRSQIRSIVRQNGSINAHQVGALFYSDAPHSEPWLDTYATDEYSSEPIAEHRFLALKDVSSFVGRYVPAAEASYTRDGRLVRIAFGVWRIDGF